MSDHPTELPPGQPTQLFIGGRWADAASGGRFSVHDPSTGEALAEVVDASAEDALLALGAAAEAAEPWARTPARERGELLYAAFSRVLAEGEALARLITLEMGKPLHEARAEVRYGAEFLRWFAEEAPRVAGRYASTPEGTGQMIVSKRPVGPCFLITPWNFPLAMATRKIAPALAAGCTVVIKPAAQAPLTTLYLAKIFEELGLPAGVLNVVTTSRAGELASPLLRDARLRKLSFTGSTAVGRRLLSQAAEGVLRASMELGGNAPFLVFEDADLEAAAAGAMLAKFRNGGEACTAANRFLVHERVADAFTRLLRERVAALRVGRGTEPGVDIGPLIDEAAVRKVSRLVADARSRGARCLVGGERLPGPGHFYAPTLLTEVPAGAAILHEEVFGPVLSISTFASEAEAVRRANESEHGLVSYVFTRDLARAQRMIEAIESGMMGLNVGAVSNAAAPFGGVKQSGLGREGGAEGIEEYLETKYTLTPAP